MILNLRGNVLQNGVIDFDLTPIYFDTKSFVAVTKVWVRLHSKAKEVTTTIKSSLVDKCPVNSNQELVFCHQRENSRTIFYTPTHLASYKIQCQALHFSVFEIHCSDESGNNPKIENVYLQLKITNARI